MLPVPHIPNFVQFFTRFFHLHFVLYKHLPKLFSSTDRWCSPHTPNFTLLSTVPTDHRSPLIHEYPVHNCNTAEPSSPAVSSVGLRPDDC